MKKYLSLLLATVVLLTSLVFITSCGGEEESAPVTNVPSATQSNNDAPAGNEPVEEPEEKVTILGTWGCDLDMAELFNEAMAMEEMGDAFVIDEFIVPLMVEFKDDDTYMMFVEEEKFMESMTSVIETLKEAMIAYLMEMTGVSSVEELDKLLEAEGGLDAMLDAAINEEMFRTMVEEMVSEGNYAYEDGKLYTTEALDEEIDQSKYDVITLTADTFTFEENVGNDPEDTEFADAFYPLEFTRVG